MTRHLVRILIVVCLSAPRVSVAGPEQAAFVGLAMTEHREVAEKLLERWRAESKALAGVLELAPGYPMIASKADYPGIEAGLYVVVLGVCRVDTAKELKRQLESFMVPISSRAVGARGSISCPKRKGDWAFVPESRRMIEASQSLLQSAVFSRRDSQTGVLQHMLHVYARGPNFELTDHRALVFPPGCSAALSEDADVLRVEKTCTAKGEKPKEVLRFTARDGKIVAAPDASALADLEALVWAAGPTDAAARDALSRWQRESKLVADFVSLPPGYPRIVKAEDHDGLAPGSHAVLLGLCPASRLDAEGGWAALQAFDPNLKRVHVKVRAGEPACPVQKHAGGVAWRRTLRRDAHDLSVVTFVDPGYQWQLHAFLRGPTGALVDSRRVAPDDPLIHHEYIGLCLAPEARETTERVEVSFPCLGRAENDFFSEDHGWTAFLTYSVENGKIRTGKRIVPRRPSSR